MARRASLALLGAGIGLTVLVPIIGIPAMVMAAVGLAISLEHEMVPGEPAPGPLR